MPAIIPLSVPRCTLGEGATYDAASGELSWVDIPASRAYCWTGSLEARDAAPEAAFTFRLTDGCVIEGAAQGLAFPGGRVHVPPGLGPDEALNDAAVHPSGRMLVLGSRHRAESAALGRAWTLSETGWQAMEQRFTVFNGPAFSPDGSWLYYADSALRTIWRRAVGPTDLSLGPAQVFVRTAPDAGYPDGSAIDDEGCLWSAHWDGARLTRYRPDGSTDRVQPLPVARATSLAFFGLHRDRIAVTTALPDGVDTARLPDSDLSGRVLTLLAGVSGPARPRLDAGLFSFLTGDQHVQALP